MGVSYEDGKTTFKVWAPTSTEVGVYIYDYGTPRSLLGYGEDEGNEAAHDAWDLYRLKNLGQGVWGVTVDDEDLGENIVAEDFQKGYMYKDSVLRHSMVKVAN